MDLIDELMSMERVLANGAGADYDRLLHTDAVVIVPGAVLDRQQCIAAMDESPGWDEVGLADPRLVRTSATATVVYTFTGVRAASRYRATLASTYTQDDDGSWRLLLHQQTPTDV